MVHLTGRLICTDLAQADTVTRYLPDHIARSRAEPGCRWFRVSQSDDPLIWTLDEGFADAAAFAVYQIRTRASVWWQDSGPIARDFQIGDQPNPAIP